MNWCHWIDFKNRKSTTSRQQVGLSLSQLDAWCSSSGVYIPEFVLEPVLGANVRLPFTSGSPAASQVFSVPGPAGQIDRFLWRHWDRKEGGWSGVRCECKGESIAERKWRENAGSVRVQRYCSHYLCNSLRSDVPQKLVGFSLNLCVWVCQMWSDSGSLPTCLVSKNTRCSTPLAQIKIWTLCVSACLFACVVLLLGLCRLIFGSGLVIHGDLGTSIPFACKRQ